MLRSSRLNMLTVLSVALTVAAVPIVTKSVDARLAEAAPSPSTTIVPDSNVTAFTLHRFQVPTMRFEATGDAVVDAPLFPVEHWSPRLQKGIQKAAFRHAVSQTFASRDFSPGTFAGAMLDSLVDFAGPDNVIEAAKSYRPKPDQYRILLRAIRDRTPASDPGGQNRSS